jgi:hypothetical protein
VLVCLFSFTGRPSENAVNYLPGVVQLLKERATAKATAKAEAKAAAGPLSPLTSPIRVIAKKVRKVSEIKVAVLMNGCNGVAVSLCLSSCIVDLCASCQSNEGHRKGYSEGAPRDTS